MQEPYDAYILDAVRSPRAKAKKTGALHSVKPIELMAHMMTALAERTDIDPAAIDDVLLGCVTATGEQGANLAKIAALYAGWPDTVSGATVNRFCASGLSACALAAMKVSCGESEVVAAGGVESMSRVPMFADRGPWFADTEVAEKTAFVHMGISADLVATREGFTREQLDDYAARSHRRAAHARDQGHFQDSIVAIPTPRGSSADQVAIDELIRDGTTVESLARLPAAFADIGKGGADQLARSRYPELAEVRHLHHVGNAPAMADGASLLFIANRARADALGIRPRARIRSSASHSVEPVLMLTGNVACSQKAMERAGVSASDIDVFEVNESFAAIPLHYQRHLGLEPDRVNADGGAIALGHPIGATGGVLLSMALDQLERRDGTLALVSICGGAGVTTSLVVERCA